MTLDQFIAKYRGKRVEVAGSANALNQCTDLVNAYYREVWSVPIVVWTNAVDFPSKVTFPLTFINETPTLIPEKGWVVVFKRYGSLYGSPGHIAVVTEKTDINNLYVFEQNWPTGSVCKVNRHNYRGVVGYIRISSTTGVMTEKTYTQAEWQQERDERNKNWELYQDSLKELTQSKETAEQRKKEYDQLLEYLAEKLTTTVDVNEIKGALARLLAVEESKRQIEKVLHDEELRHDAEVNQLVDEISDLRSAVQRQQKENETLISRLETLEKKADQTQDKKETLTLLQTFITAFTKAFERK